jgi:uncharacterized protein DUF3617
MRIPIIVSTSLVAAACSGSNSIEPGQWERTTTFTPSAIGIATTITDKHCLTPGQAREPTADSILGSLPEACAYENFSMTGGGIRGAARCGENGAAPTTLNGQFDSASYEMNLELKETELGAQTVKIAARRTGDCPR